MNKLYFFAMLTAAQIGYAQTILTSSANKPVIGDINAGRLVIGTVDNSASGTATTFANPSLVAGPTSTSTYSAPLAAEISAFSGSNLKQEDPTGTVLLFKSTANKLEITGLTNPTATLNFSADNGTYLSYPVSYSYNSSDNARGTFTSAVASGIFKGNIVGTSGASGTLIIGANSFPNVLRVKIVQNYNLYQATDTFYLFPIGNFTTTTYQYYDNLRKFPLLTDTSGTVSVPLANINQTDNFAVALPAVFLSNSEVKANSSFSIYPNPAVDKLMFQGLSKKQNTAKVYSADGKLVLESTIKANEIGLSGLPSGAYFIMVSGEDAVSKSIPLIKK